MKRTSTFTALIFALVLINSSRADVIVDNFSESGSGGYALRFTFGGTTSSAIAQQFNTGGQDYRLGSISTMIQRDTATADFSVGLWSTSVNGKPNVSLASFYLANTPTLGVFDMYVFKPNTSLLLDGQTEYFFSVENNVGLNSAIANSAFGSNNYSGPGNILENVRSSQDSGITWGNQNSNAVLLRVESVPEPSSLLILSVLGCAIGLHRRPNR